jgi:hypothetical protein
MEFLTALIPAQYQPLTIAVLGIMVAVTHLMTLIPATSGIAAKILAPLQIVAGNYGNATNANAPATPSATITTLKIIPLTLGLGLAAMLSACGGTAATSTTSTSATTSWATDVQVLQTAWPLAEAYINSNVTMTPTITNLEQALTTDINGLNPAATPSLGTMVTDLNNLVDALPLTVQQEATVNAVALVIKDLAAVYAEQGRPAAYAALPLHGAP